MFNKLKNKTILINVSRGKIINTHALIKAINKQKILAAGLDVLDPDTENYNKKLLKMKNIIVTPHIAGISDNFNSRNFILIKNNIMRYLNKKN